MFREIKLEEKSWILVDCGNSAYFMAITTALLPIILGMFENVRSSMDLGYLIDSAQGGIQALSGSYYAKIVPKEKSNKFNIFRKFAAIVGLAVMSLTTAVTGNARLSILGIIPLFIIGFVVFISLPKEQNFNVGITERSNYGYEKLAVTVN